MISRGLDSLQRPESLARRAYLALRKAIRDRVIAPDTLYSELQLAASLNISRTPVREALIELSREGIIEVVPQRGFRVRPISKEEEREVFDLRAAIECYVVRRLADAATDKDVAKLTAILDRQERAAGDLVRFLEYDEQFHLTMPELLGLARTRELLNTLRGIMFLAGSAALALPERTDEVTKEHRKVVKAIAAHDADRAIAAITDHLDRTRAHTNGRTQVNGKSASRELVKAGR
jgi:DNA-binding GntR family transcriptional regulator